MNWNGRDKIDMSLTTQIKKINWGVVAAILIALSALFINIGAAKNKLDNTKEDVVENKEVLSELNKCTNENRILISKNTSSIESIKEKVDETNEMVKMLLEAELGKRAVKKIKKEFSNG